MIERVISGGQTGIDRVALDIGLEVGLPIGGWCPRGRRAEDGVIDSKYPLVETASRNYRVRTQRNVQEADATLILSQRPLTGGTALTYAIAIQEGKPVRIVDPTVDHAIGETMDWLQSSRVSVLNVAGPRQSESSLNESAADFLRRLFGQLAGESE